VALEKVAGSNPLGHPMICRRNVAPARRPGAFDSNPLPKGVVLAPDGFIAHALLM
jgi:hypothetical protein